MHHGLCWQSDCEIHTVFNSILQRAHIFLRACFINYPLNKVPQSGSNGLFSVQATEQCEDGRGAVVRAGVQCRLGAVQLLFVTAHRLMHTMSGSKD